MSYCRAIAAVFALFFCLQLSAQSLTGVSPPRAKTNAARDANVVANFSTAMQTPTTASFRVSGSFTGPRPGVFSGGGTSALTFDPAANFRPNELVSVTLTNGVVSTGSAPLSNPTTWQFIAASAPGPMVLGDFRSLVGTGGSDLVRAADFNGDGAIDLVVKRSIGARVYWNNGTGGFSGSSFADIPGISLVTDFAPGDIDNDGDIDIMLGVSNLEPRVALNNGAGGFTVVVVEPTVRTSWRPILGDIDNDGDLDIVAMTGNASAALQIHTNNGAGLFTTGATFGTGFQVRTALADVDNDGDLDLATSYEWYLNDGLGAFPTSTVYPFSNQMSQVSLGDVDGDGDVDMACQDSGFSNLRIVLNNGSGTFVAGQVLPDGDSSFSFGDFDGDGDLDLLRIKSGVLGTRIFANDGLGTFSLAYTMPTGAYFSGNSSAVADFDGDGDLDVAAARSSSLPDVEIMFNRVLDTDVTLSAGPLVEPVSVNSVTGSAGFSDVLDLRLVDGGSTAAQGMALARVIATVTGTADVSLHEWVLNVAGGPSFAGTISGGVGSQALTFLTPGLTAPNAGVLDLQIQVKLAASPGTSQDGKTFLLSVLPADLLLVGASQFGPSQPTIASPAPVTYQAVATQLMVVTQPPSGVGTGVPFAVSARYTDIHGNLDVDVQGDLLTAVRSDLGTVTSGISAPAVNGTASFIGSSSVVVGAPAASNVYLVLTDNAGGSINLAAAPANTQTFNIALLPTLQSVQPANNATGAALGSNVQGSFSAPMAAPAAGQISVHSAMRGRLAGALTGGGTTTLTFTPSVALRPGEVVDVSFTGALLDATSVALANPGVSRFTALAGAGPGFFRGAQREPLTGQVALALADVDGDGDLDLLGSTAASVLVVSINTGAGIFGAAATYGAATASAHLVPGDFDGDGDMDVLCVTNNQLQVLLNSGAGAFTATAAFGSSAGALRPACGDFDADGDIDIVAQEGALLRLYVNNGSALFSPGPSLGASSFVVALAGDFNGDRRLDLAAAGSAGVQVFINTGAAFSLPVTVSAGAASTLAIGDVDADGDIDIAVGALAAADSLWLNDGSAAFSAGGPVGAAADTRALLFADLDGDGDLDLARATDGGAFNTWQANHLGVFGAEQTLETVARSALGVAAADLDGDGDLDLGLLLSDGTARVCLNAVTDMTLSVSPSEHARNAARSTNVSATFAGPMGVPGPGNFIVSGGFTGRRAGTYFGGGTATPGLDPASDFKPGEVVSVTINRGMLDAASAPIDYPVVWRFRAAAGTGPATFSALQHWVLTDNLQAVHMTVADLDGDGDVDMAASTSAGIKLRFNDGAGAFGNPSSLASSFNVLWTVAGDIDQDGDIDILARTSNDRMLVVRNTPSGFVTTEDIAGATSRLVLADLTGDGFPEVVCGGFFWKNSGSGAFGWNGSKVTLSTTSNISTGAVADTDLDGDLDYLFWAGGNTVLYSNDGLGNFALAHTVASTGSRSEAADLDGDGDPDFVARGTGGLFWLRNDGGTLVAQAVVPGTANTNGLVVADLDGDGDLDVAMAAAAGGGLRNMALLNNGSGVFGAPVPFGTGSGLAGDIAFADMDGDGDIDLVTGENGRAIVHFNAAVGVPALLGHTPASGTANMHAGQVIHLEFNRVMSNINTNATLPTFSNLHSQSVATEQLVESGFNILRLADFKANEQLEVVVTSALTDQDGTPVTNPRVIRLRASSTGPGDANFAAPVSVGGASEATRAIAAGDLNFDNKIDLVLCNFGGPNVIYYGDGAGNFTAGPTVGTGTDNTQFVLLMDFNRDNRLDVVLGNNGQSAVYLNAVSSPFTTSIPLGGVTGNITGLACGDLNLDGWRDIVAVENGGQNRVYLNSGGAALQAGAPFGGSGSFSRGVAVADLDDDGDLDIVVGNDGSLNQYFLNNGGAFGAGQNLASTLLATQAVAVGDLNGDAKVDIIFGNNGPNEVHMNNGAGGFGSGATFGLAGQNTRALDLGDFDGDGDLDVAVANDGSQAGVYLNNGAGSLATAKLFGPLLPAGHGIAAVDFDGDRILELAIGVNLGQSQVFRNQFVPVRDFDTTLTPSAVLAEPATISSLVGTQGPVPVLDFKLTDGGAGDGLPTRVTAIRVNVTGGTAGTGPWLLNGPGAVNITASSIAAGYVQFSGLNLVIANGNSQTFTVSMQLQPALSAPDGTIWQLSVGVLDVTVDQFGTGMAAAGSVDNGAGMALAVAATRLTVLTQPPARATQQVGFALSAAYTDVYGRVDRDVADSVTLSRSDSGAVSSPAVVAAVNGVVDFSGANVVRLGAPERIGLVLVLTDDAGGVSAGSAQSMMFDLSALIVWTGAVSTAWDNAGNWSPAIVPGQFDSVRIPSGTPNIATLPAQRSVLDLSIAQGADLNLGSTSLIVNRFASIEAVLGAHTGRLQLPAGSTLWCAPGASVHNLSITGTALLASDVKVRGNITTGNGGTLNGLGFEVNLGGTTAQLVSAAVNAHVRVSNTAAVVSYEPTGGNAWSPARRLFIDAGGVMKWVGGSFTAGTPSPVVNNGEIRIEGTFNTIDAGGVNIGSVRLVAGAYCYFDNLGAANTGTFTIEAGARLSPRGTTDLSNATLANQGHLTYITSGPEAHVITLPAANIGNFWVERPAPGTLTIATPLVCNDLWLRGTSSVTFQGLVTVNGHLEHKMASTVIPRLVMAGSGARTVTAQAARIDELVIDGAVDALLTGDIALRSVQAGTNRALTINAGAALQLAPSVVVLMGTAAAGAEARLDGVLRTVIPAAQIRPKMQAVGPGFVVQAGATGNLDLQGLILQGLGRTGIAYGLVIPSGATLTKFDQVELPAASGSTAVIQLANTMGPAAIAGLRVDGTAPKNIDATGFSGGVITISPASSGGGNIYGAAFEIDPANKLNWQNPFTLVSVSPPANKNNVLPGAPVSATFSGPAAMPAAGAFKIRGAYTGNISGNPGGGGTATLLQQASRAFFPGEPVEVTLTTDITDTTSSPLAKSHVYNFRAAASGGTAVFGFPTDTDAGTSALASFVADMNRDGFADLVFANMGGTAYVSAAIRICLNDGAGNFQSVQTLESTNSASTQIMDFNQDGWPDVVIAGHQHIFIHLNNGTGNVSVTPIDIATSAIMYQTCSGDFNGDGYPDLIGSADTTASVPAFLFLNNKQGAFVAAAAALPSHTAQRYFPADVDNDGDLDVVRGSMILLNDGAASFQAITWTATAYTHVMPGDLDGDGDIDLFAMRSGGQDAVWLGNGAGLFTQGPNIGAGVTQYTHGSLGDLDGDGDLDAVVNSSSLRIAYINAGNATFGTSPLPSSGAQYAVPLGDLDGDGDLDAVFRDSVGLRVYFNDTRAPLPPTLVGRVPAAHVTAARDVNVQAQFSTPIGTPPAGSIRVSGSQTGRRAGVQGLASPSILEFNPAADFKPGERVGVLVNSGVGTPPSLSKHGWSFWARSVANNTPTFDSTTSALPVSATLNAKCVAVGDFDGDGDVDAVVGVSGAPSQIYLNNGQGLFSLGATLGLATDTRALVAVDIDFDGDVDLLEANYGLANSIYLNNGGVFTLFGAFGTGADNTTSLDVGDADQDGDLDILVGNYAQQSRLYTNNGSLGFSTFVNIGPGTGTTTCVALVDILADGRPEVFLGNETGSSQVYKQQLGLTFTLNWEPLLTGIKACAAADQNQDGYCDLLCAGHNWLMGSVSTSVINWGPALDASALGVALTEANGDNHVDHVQARAGVLRLCSSAGSGPQLASFGSAASLTAAVAAADFDGDGRADILAIGPLGTESKVYFLRQGGPMLQSVTPSNLEPVTGMPQLRSVFDVGMQPGTGATSPVFSSLRGRVAGNYSTMGSPYTTLVFTPSANLMPGETLTLVASTGLLGLSNATVVRPGTWTLRVKSNPGSGVFTAAASGIGGSAEVCVEGDFDNDGDVDLCVAGGAGAQTRVFWNSNGLSASTLISSGKDTRALCAADLDGDGDLDLIEGNFGQAGNVHLNTNGAFGAALPFGPASPTRGLSVNDFNGDGKLDVFVVNNGGQSAIYNGNGSGGFAGTTLIGGPTDTFTCVAVATRIDNTYKLPWILLGRNGQNVAYTFANGTYSQVSFGTGTDNTQALAAGDFNGDGRADVVIGNSGSETATLCMGSAAGFATPVAVGSAAGAYAIAIADLDGDSNLDLVLVRGASSDSELLLGNGGGGFGTPASIPTGIDSRSACVGDFDADGDLDIFFTGTSQGRVWLNGGSAPVIVSLAPPRHSYSAPVAGPWGATLTSAPGATAPSFVRVYGGQDGPLAVSPSVNGNSLSFTPTGVRAGATYRVTLGTGLPTQGGTLGQPHTWIFQAATTALPVLFAQPFDVAGTNTWKNVSVADFDDDGDLDIVAITANDLVLLTQTAPMVFTPSTPFGFSSTDMHSTFPADLNGDGRMDLILKLSPDGVRTFISQATGGWVSAQVTANGSIYRVFDFDGDGDEDFIAYVSQTGTYLYKNDGAGVFTNSGLLGGSVIFPGKAGVVDFNGDGLMDLSLAQGLRNIGNGQFVQQAGLPGNAAAFADLDNDGDVDCVGDTHFHLNNGGQFVNGAAHNFQGAFAASGDVDGDGDLDLLYWAAASDVHYLYRNDGGFNFALIPLPAMNNFGLGALFADMNGDGRLDLVAQEYNGTVRVVLQGAGVQVTARSPQGESLVATTVPVQATFDMAMNPATLAAGGIVLQSNMRGKLPGSGALTTGNTVIEYTPAGSFRAGEVLYATLPTGMLSSTGAPLLRPYAWRFRAGGMQAAAAFVDDAQLYSSSDNSRECLTGDFDGDGDLDLLVSAEVGQDYIYWNNGSGVFSTRSAFGAATSAYARMAAADLDLDGDLDIVLTRDALSIQVCLNNGAGVFAITNHAQAGTQPVLADLNADGFPDLVTTKGCSMGTGTGTFGTAASFPAGVALLNLVSLAVADFNSDAMLDVAVAGQSPSQIVILLNIGGTLTPGPTISGLTYAISGIEAADFDADGDADIVVGPNGNTPRVLRNAGAGNLIPWFAASQSAVAGFRVDVADFNGDGRLDFLVSGASPMLYTGTAAGSFTLARSFSGLSGQCIGDFDGDGRVDFIALRSNQTDRVWLNLPPQGALDATLTLQGTPAAALDSVAAAQAPATVMTFRVADGGALDAEGVAITGMSFAISGLAAPGEHAWTLVPGAGASVTGVYSATPSPRIVFTGLNIQVPSAGNIDCQLRVQFAVSPLLTQDNDLFHVSLSNSTVLFGAGSQFAGSVANTGGTAYSVVATHLAWVNVPGNGAPGMPLAAQPVVRAADAAGNLDRDAAGSVVIDASTVAPGPVVPVLGERTRALVNGTASYTNLQVDQAGTQYRLRASYGAITSDSPPFDVAVGAVPQPPLFVSLRVTDADAGYRAGETISLRAVLNNPGFVVTANLGTVDTALGAAVAFTDNANGTYVLTSPALSAATLVQGSNLAIVVTATNVSGLSATRSVLVSVDETAPTATLRLNKPAIAVGPGPLRISLTSSEPLATVPKISVSGLTSVVNVTNAAMEGAAPSQAFHYVLNIPTGVTGTGQVSISNAFDVAGNPAVVGGTTQFTLAPTGSLAALAQGPGALDGPRRITLDAAGSTGATGHDWVQVGGPAATLATPTQVTTTADLIVAGAYSFLLTVTDGSNSVSDIVNVTLANSDPVVDAGRDQYFRETDVVLAGGIPLTPLALRPRLFDRNGDALGSEWVMLGTPPGGNLRVRNAGQLDSRVEVLGSAIVPGVYTLGLRAWDTTNLKADLVVTASTRIVVSSSTVMPPASHAGLGVVGMVGVPVQLSGHESADSDAPNPLSPSLSYFWTMERRPPGSVAAIQGDTLRQPTFVPDVPGTYVASLVVIDDDGLVSGRDSVTLVVNRQSPANSVPRCVLDLQFTDADSNGALNVGEAATVSAAGSVDGENDAITYLWRQVSGPAVVFLADPTAVSHAVSFPVAGNYVFRVQVWDATDVGIPADITVSVAAAGKVPPVAVAAIDAADDPDTDGYVLMIPGVGVNNSSANPSVEVSAAGSSVDSSLTASYRWALVHGPTVPLSGADTATVSFVPLISRVYELELTVTDSSGVSATKRVAIAVDTWDASANPGGNAVPRVTSAPDQTVLANTQVVLSGSATDANDGQSGLVYIWVQRLGPPVFLDTANPAAPTFTAPIAGTYGFTLYVDDGHDISPGFDVVVKAEAPVTPPPAPAADDGGKSDPGCSAQVAGAPVAAVALLAGFAAFRRRRKQ